MRLDVSVHMRSTGQTKYGRSASDVIPTVENRRGGADPAYRAAVINEQVKL